jgi:hypothetical protein
MSTCMSTRMSGNRPDLPSDQFKYQHRINMMLDFICKTCGHPSGDRNVDAQMSGSREGMSPSVLLPALLPISTGHSHRAWDRCITWLMDRRICGPCKPSFRRDVMALRTRLWEELPSVVGLSSSELLATDLPEPQVPSTRTVSRKRNLFVSWHKL